MLSWGGAIAPIEELPCPMSSKLDYKKTVAVTTQEKMTVYHRLSQTSQKLVQYDLRTLFPEIVVRARF